MFKFFNYINYFLKAKQGAENPVEMIAETSFGFLELYFVSTFIVFGIFTGGLGFAAFYYDNNIVLFVAIVFLAMLVFDIWLYTRIKKFFKKMAVNAVDYSKNFLKKDTDEKPYEFKIEVD